MTVMLTVTAFMFATTSSLIKHAMMHRNAPY